MTTTTTTTTTKYEVWLPRVPGVTPSLDEQFDTFAEAYEYARSRAGRRPDLRKQDVRILFRGRQVATVGSR